MQTLGVIQAETGEDPKELRLLVQMCMVLSHGQGMVERGFSHTKWFVKDRASMKDNTVKSLKLVKGSIDKSGGAEKVPLTTQLLNSVKHAVRNQRKEEEKERARVERENVEEAAQVQAAAKRKREENYIKCWEAKKVDIEEQIAALKDVIRVNRNNVKELIEKGFPVLRKSICSSLICSITYLM